MVYFALVSEQKLGTVPCPYCRGIILLGAQRCKYCYAELAGLWSSEASDRKPTKNPALATLLSVLCPGLGQYYTGRTDKAIMFVFVFVIFVGLFYWLTFPWVLVATWAGYDAFREARKTR